MQNTIIYKNVKVNYVDFGEGNVTLFLHGWEGNVNSFLYFAKQIKGRKILIDFPPFGASESLKEKWGLYDYVGLVKYLMSSLKISKYNIIAHSFGGRIALILGAGKNVDKMVLTGCAGIKDKSIKLKLKICKYKVIKLMAKLKLYKKSKLQKIGSNDYIKLSPIMKRTFNSIVNTDLTNILKYVNSDTLLIWGEKDEATKLKNGKLMKNKIKNCGLYIIKNGSHFAYLEYPEIFLNAIKVFLKV